MEQNCKLILERKHSTLIIHIHIGIYINTKKLIEKWLSLLFLLLLSPGYLQYNFESAFNWELNIYPDKAQHYIRDTIVTF